MTTTARIPSPSLRALVAGLVDYAGLFPPASLGMPEAVAQYASYLGSPDAWMLDCRTSKYGFGSSFHG